jgi:Circularly permutated YpsA SLOG family
MRDSYLPLRIQPTMLQLTEHHIPGYRARTLVNAAAADLTVAFAADFGTAGEFLTRKAAGRNYLAISLSTPTEAAGQALADCMRTREAFALNVAGNGISTLVTHGWTQESVNIWVYQVLHFANQAIPIKALRSGGQTGTDIAGLVAACELSIPALGYFPKGFIQRGADHIDCHHSPDQVRQQVAALLSTLRKDLRSCTRPYPPRGQTTFDF